MIGLITYHSAYNFGSVLQTYATVKTIENLGYQVETIDYRTPSQTFWYQTDYNLKKTKKELLLNIGFNFIKKSRNIRKEKFEEFIKKFLNPSKDQYHSYQELLKVEFQYETLISGSDQIWNFNCREFEREPYESILPYFLQFGSPKKRIAYASSIGVNTLRYVKKHKDLFNSYDFISTREPIGKRYIEQVVEKDVELVCDPTWLLDKKQWSELPGLYKPVIDRPYILIYSLSWHLLNSKKWFDAICELAKKKDMDIFCISPLMYLRDKRIKFLNDAGPVDFLSFVLNASLIITNTFHGTIIPINLEVPVYSCNVLPGSRQGQILELCDLEDRIIQTPQELLEETDYSCVFSKSTKLISEFRKSSIEYLYNSIQL